jgi:hypothetical protein
MDLLKINLEDVVIFHSGEDNLEIIINKTKSEDWEDIKNQ